MANKFLSGRTALLALIVAAGLSWVLSAVQGAVSGFAVLVNDIPVLGFSLLTFLLVHTLLWLGKMAADRFKLKE